MTHGCQKTRKYFNRSKIGVDLELKRKHMITIDTFTVFCPGYLEWWLDSNLYLVLFIQYILNTVSVAYMYICIIWEVVNSFNSCWVVVIPDQCGQNTAFITVKYLYRMRHFIFMNENMTSDVLERYLLKYILHSKVSLLLCNETLDKLQDIYHETKLCKLKFKHLSSVGLHTGRVLAYIYSTYMYIHVNNGASV